MSSFVFAIVSLVGCALTSVYCYTLSRKLDRFRRVEDGIGAAISVLSVQVSEMSRTLDRTSCVTADAELRLNAVIESAGHHENYLRLLLAGTQAKPNGITSEPDLDMISTPPPLFIRGNGSAH